MTTEQQPQMLPSEPNRCAMCEKPIPPTKSGAGKARMYCGPACKQAAHRQRRRLHVEARERGQALGPLGNKQVWRDGVPICALEGCEQPAERGKRGRWKMYCCDCP